MADEIKAGDVVQLKSGGPKMTVTGVKEFNGLMKAWCSWFDDKGKESHNSFPLSSLKRLE